MSALLSLRQVGAAHGKAAALFEIGLDMKPATATAVLGRNGVGKTTLLRTIVGQHRLSKGQIFLNGDDIAPLPAHLRARRGIGFAPQGRHVFPHLSVEENLIVGLSALAGRKTNDRGIPGYIWDLFPKLKAIRQRKAGFLSGGEQQQLAIGRALAGRPELLLLDEPTEGVQPSVVQDIQAALERIRTELGVGIMLVEQNLDFAWEFADQYVVLQRGRIVSQGATSERRPEDISHLIHV